MRKNKLRAQQTQSAPVLLDTSAFSAGMPMPLTVYAPPTTSSGSASMPMGRIPDSTSVRPLPSEYKMNPDNFAKMVRRVNKVEKQIAIWGKNFKPFIERIIEDALRPYRNIQLRMDNMEERVNKRLAEKSILDFANVIKEVRKMWTDIDGLIQIPQQPSVDPVQIPSDNNEGLVDLFGNPIKDQGKQAAETNETTERAVNKLAKQEERKCRIEAISPKELEAFEVKRATKKSRKSEAREQKRHKDEAAGVSTSTSPAREKISKPTRDVIPQTCHRVRMQEPHHISQMPQMSKRCTTSISQPCTYTLCIEDKACFSVRVGCTCAC